MGTEYTLFYDRKSGVAVSTYEMSGCYDLTFVASPDSVTRAVRDALDNLYYDTGRGNVPAHVVACVSEVAEKFDHVKASPVVVEAIQTSSVTPQQMADFGINCLWCWFLQNAGSADVTLVRNQLRHRIPELFREGC